MHDDITTFILKQLIFCCMHHILSGFFCVAKEELVLNASSFMADLQIYLYQIGIIVHCNNVL